MDIIITQELISVKIYGTITVFRNQEKKGSLARQGKGRIMHSRRKLLWQLFLTMFRIGAFTFGGGYAMIALLESELVSKKQWIEKDEFLNMVAIAESTPGPVAINSATYVGYKLCGVWGSLCATLGVVLPSFVIIYTISLFFDAFLSLTVVAAAFRGISVCVIYLILGAGLKMMRNLPRSPFHIAVMLVVLGLMVTLSLCACSLSAIVYILFFGVLGIVVDRCIGLVQDETEEEK